MVNQNKLLFTGRAFLIVAIFFAGLFLIYHVLDIWIFLNPPDTVPFEISEFSVLPKFRFFVEKLISFLFIWCFGLGLFGVIAITKIFRSVERNVNKIAIVNLNKEQVYLPEDNNVSKSYHPRKVKQLERWISKASTLLIYLFIISGILPTKYLYGIVRSFFPGRSDLIIVSWVVSIFIAIVNITVNVIVFRSLLKFLGKILLINLDFEQNTKKIADNLLIPDMVNS